MNKYLTDIGSLKRPTDESQIQTGIAKMDYDFLQTTKEIDMNKYVTDIGSLERKQNGESQIQTGLAKMEYDLPTDNQTPLPPKKKTQSSPPNKFSRQQKK